eukprot:412362-Prymnesium_polylepis.2
MFEHGALHRTAAGWAANATVPTIDLAAFIRSQARAAAHGVTLSLDTVSLAAHPLQGRARAGRSRSTAHACGRRLWFFSHPPPPLC